MIHRPTSRLLAGAVLAIACLVQPPQSRAEGRDAILEQPKRYSQGDEEILIRHFFNDRRDGFFVDVGAWLPREKSTTYYLEKHLGWSGISIDANPVYAEGYAKHRPKSKFFAYIVTDHSGTQDSFYVAGPLSSTTEDHLDSFKNAKVTAKEVKLPTITLNELLDREGVKKIGFLSMDIELGEPAALAGFDIERFEPELVCIEAGKPVRERLTTYFAEHGYERIEEYAKRDRINWYFRPKRAGASSDEPARTP